MASAILTGIEGATDGNGFTVGNGVKIAIGIATTFSPFGWVYGAIDLVVGVTTGTTLTDRIGQAIDNN